MKHYLEIGEHGYWGDFYRCHAVDDGAPFRADNLAIATKIAFNAWLHQFDNLYRECRLISIEDGRFTVEITEIHPQRLRHIRTNSRTVSLDVDYCGPWDMYTAEYAHRNGADWYKQKYAELERMAESGDRRVRRSHRSGLVMFNLAFPRYRRDGTWWSSEHTYLSTECALAEEQLEYVYATDAERAQIRNRNYNVMCNKREATYE